MVATAWQFGWEALVAIGTLAFAAVTLFLVLSTRRVAQASAADMRAQWRPVLLPGSGLIAHKPTEQWLRLPIRNAGRGPALFVRTLLDPLNISPDNWSLGALAPGDEVELTFSNVLVSGPHYQLLLDYRDLSGRLHSTAIVLDIQGNPPRFYDVHVYEDVAVTPHGDSLRQAGLKEVGPEPKRTPLDRWRAARDAFRSDG